jgi:hypothetical protein
MTGKEIVILITVAAATAAFGARARQLGVPQPRITAAAVAFGCGLFTVLLMIVSDSVLSQVLLLVPGVVCVGESAGVLRGSSVARRKTMIAAGATMALSLPLGGLGGAAVLLASLSGCAVAATAGFERTHRGVIEMPAAANRASLTNGQVENVAGAAA